MSNEEIFGAGLFGLFAAFAAFFFVLLFLGVILYILEAIGLYGIAKRSPKKDLAWLAWIPIAQFFLMTLLVEDDVHEGLRGKFTLIFGIAFAVVVVIGGFIPFSGLIIPAFIYYAFYFIAKRFSTNPVLHVVVGIITGGIGVVISLLMFRNREPVQANVIDSGL